MQTKMAREPKDSSPLLPNKAKVPTRNGKDPQEFENLPNIFTQAESNGILKDI